MCFDVIFRYDFSMVIAKKSKKIVKKGNSEKVSKKEAVSEVVTEKKISNHNDTDVSVFTKMTTPKVVIQSEEIDSPIITQNICRHSILKFTCLIIMGIIILMTFFLSLKTYNSVNELYLLLSN